MVLLVLADRISQKRNPFPHEVDLGVWHDLYQSAIAVCDRDDEVKAILVSRYYFVYMWNGCRILTMVLWHRRYSLSLERAVEGLCNRWLIDYGSRLEGNKDINVDDRARYGLRNEWEMVRGPFF